MGFFYFVEPKNPFRFIVFPLFINLITASFPLASSSAKRRWIIFQIFIQFFPAFSFCAYYFFFFSFGKCPCAVGTKPGKFIDVFRCMAVGAAIFSSGLWPSRGFPRVKIKNFSAHCFSPRRII